MSVDVRFTITAAEPIDELELAEHSAAFHTEFRDWERYPLLTRDDYADYPSRCLESSVVERYYGPGYERGPWPRIRDMGDWLMLRFGETAVVGYMGDCDDSPGVPWPEARAECDELWRTVGHHPYLMVFQLGRPNLGWGCTCEHCADIPIPEATR